MSQALPGGIIEQVNTTDVKVRMPDGKEAYAAPLCDVTTKLPQRGQEVAQQDVGARQRAHLTPSTTHSRLQWLLSFRLSYMGPFAATHTKEWGQRRLESCSSKTADARCAWLSSL
eukprot:4179232-Amphidinium_carterae.1